MGRYQPAKVNPELKQYYVLSNFSGGMNTNSSDEVMQDYEFRALINVDLAKEGRLEKRKGWGYDNTLNTLGVIVPEDQTLVGFDIVDDTGGVIPLVDFGVTPDDFTVDFLAITIHNINESYFVYRVRCERSSGGPISATWTSLTNGEYGFLRGTSAAHTSKLGLTLYRDYEKLYFLLGDLPSTFQGLGVYDIVNNTYSTIQSNYIGSTYYSPYPVELTTLGGVNILSDTPLLSVNTSYSSISTIHNVLLGKSGSTTIPLDYIPLDTMKFRLFVYASGYNLDAVSTALKDDLFVDVITDGNSVRYDNLPYTVETLTKKFAGDGSFYVDLKLDALPKSGEIFMNLEINAPTADYYMSSFEEAKSMLEWYNAGRVTDFLLFYSPNDPSDLYGMVKTNYNMDTLYPVVLDQANLLGSGTEFYYNVSLGKVYEFYNGSYSGSEYNIASVLDNGILTDRRLIPDFLFNFNKYIKTMGAIPAYYKITSVGGLFNLEFYSNSSFSSFNTILKLAKDTSVPYTHVFDSDYKDKIKLTKILDRLVMYAGNSIYFSAPNNFNYFPANNYLVLDIDYDDEITNISYFRGSYLVFTRKTIWKMSGQIGDINSWSFILINDSIGCVAPRSVRSIENTVIFLSADGLYRVKQAYYMEGLENVEKVDKHVRELIAIDYNAEAIINDEQYTLFSNEFEDYDAIRYYYTIDIPNGHPFVVDSFGSSENNKPSILFKLGKYLYTSKNGVIYSYGQGYYDLIEKKSDIYPLNSLFIVTIANTKNVYKYLGNGEVSLYYTLIPIADGSNRLFYTNLGSYAMIDSGNNVSRLILGDTSTIPLGDRINKSLYVYDQTNTYSLNDVVSYANLWFRALKSVPSNNYPSPGSTTEYWQYLNFEAKLEEVVISDSFEGLPDENDLMINTDEELTNATYTTTIVTSNNSFGYPTHTKKMKSMYIKTDAKTAVPFYISIALDNETDATLTTEDMVPMLDPITGSITYVPVDTPNLTLIGQTMDPSALLDYFILNKDILNSNTPTQLVKLPFSGKGRNIKVMIKQKSPDYFAIENIGFLFKLGKVRENRR